MPRGALEISSEPVWLRSKRLLWLGVCSAVACQQVPCVTLPPCQRRHCWRNRTQRLYRDLGEVNSAFCTHTAASPRGFSNLIAEARSCHGDPGEPGHKFTLGMQLGSEGRRISADWLGPPLWEGLSAALSPLLKWESLPDILTDTPRIIIWHQMS